MADESTGSEPRVPKLNERILSSMSKRTVAAHPWHDLEIGLQFFFFSFFVCVHICSLLQKLMLLQNEFYLQVQELPMSSMLYVISPSLYTPIHSNLQF